ncbi:hormone-sensitive lipase [Thraustotheca clavata]|uniref:Hormone-sensitive lipase n=1 Tax=Thraustotheca clavata TaxID=74557 RepID=A0A1V9Y8M3_9STRA|nr:hormone-sensitive lipase [Thraustotheca clavata]
MKLQCQEDEMNNAMPKSQSTVLLLGQIPMSTGGTNAMLTPGSPVSSNHKDDVALLIATSTAVLSTIQVLRRIIRENAYGRVGRELQHLSLTVASFERVLYSFIKEEIICDPSMDYRDKQALKDIIPLIPREKRHAILAGGVASLLRHVAMSMEDTREVLTRLTENYDPFWENRWSVTPFVVAAVVFYITRRRLVHGQSFRSIISTFVPSLRKVEAGVVALVCYDYAWRLSYRFSMLRQLKVHHSRVLMTLRLFLLCQHVLDRTRLNRSKSHRLLIDAPIEADINDNLKSASVLLIERVPLPSEIYDRSHEHFGLTAFKAGSAVMLASSATARWLLGDSLFPHLGSYLAAILVPYYGIRFKKASRYVTRHLMDNPDVTTIRTGWQLFGESFLACKMALLQAPKIAVRHQIYVNVNGVAAGRYQRDPTDIGVRIFSSRSMDHVKQGSWPENEKCPDKLKQIGLPYARPVLIYVHGGGFFGRFLAKDLLTLSNWAVALGAVIVYIDYGLAPEMQYPNSLNQCFTVYKWVLDGGLGFVPSSVAFFGESAGGNLAAALTVKCILEKVRIPNGIVLVYPALNMHLSPSPSRFLHQSDPILPRAILELALNSYYPSHGASAQYKDNIHDPKVSPGLADDTILAQFPPTSLMVGDLDPLLDDSIDFHTRLTSLRVSSTLKVLPDLTHGFLIYGDMVPAAQNAIDDMCHSIYAIFKRQLA